MCAVICRNDHCYASRAQKPHFCVKTTKNVGKIAHSDTKTSILCSKGRKMGVPKPKSAQKPRFCARRASQNSTERLSGAHRTARRSSAEHGTSKERPGAAREQSSETEQDRLGRSATARSTMKRNRHATQHTQRNRSTTKRNRLATQPLRQRQGTATQWHNKKGDNLSGCLL